MIDATQIIIIDIFIAPCLRRNLHAGNLPFSFQKVDIHDVSRLNLGYRHRAFIFVLEISRSTIVQRILLSGIHIQKGNAAVFLIDRHYHCRISRVIASHRWNRKSCVDYIFLLLGSYNTARSSTGEEHNQTHHSRCSLYPSSVHHPH